MYRVDAYQCEMLPVQAEGAAGVRIQWLLDEMHGAPSFAMRRFVIEPGGNTPYHAHDWEHEIYVLAGRARAFTPETSVEVGPGDVLLIPPDEPHGYECTGDESFVFLCIVPNGVG